jgi:hypothetical protein
VNWLICEGEWQGEMLQWARVPFSCAYVLIKCLWVRAGIHRTKMKTFLK